MGAKLSGSGGGRFALGQNAEINVTPFVDIMLVLLIIFMVAAPVATVAVKVDLPPPDPHAIKPPRDPVIVNVQPQGKLYVGQAQTSMAALNGAVTSALDSPNPHSERVMIHAVRGVKYAELMAVMNTLQGAGFTKVGIISENL